MYSFLLAIFFLFLSFHVNDVLVSKRLYDDDDNQKTQPELFMHICIQIGSFVNTLKNRFETITFINGENYSRDMKWVDI